MRCVMKPLACLLALATGNAASAAPIRTGNDYYVVLADPARNGAYAVATGPSHPVTIDQGAESNVLRGGFGAVGAGISFNSVRSYGSSTDYFFGMPRFLLVSDPDFECVVGNDAAAPSITTISDGARDVGLRLAWEVHRGGDNLLIEERLVARGDEVTNSVAEITLSVTNLGADDARLGFRYAWSLALGNRGGAGSPTIGPKPPEPPTEPYYRNEQSLENAEYRSYIVSNEETPSNPGTFDDNEYVVEATMGGIPLDPPPTPPERFILTLFGEQLAPPQPARFGPLNSCFDYEIADPPRPVYNAAGTGVVYLWGDTPDTALIVRPGETVSVTQYVFAYLDFPLVCDAGAPQTVECAGATTAIELDGSGSVNLEDDEVKFLWTTHDPAVVIENETSEHPLAHVSELGRHELTLLAHRGGFATSCTTEVEVVDTTPPIVREARVTPAVLWPPNHRLVPVHVVLEAEDLCDAEPSIRLVSVESSEPDEIRRGGDGNTRGDIRDAALGTADFDLLLRAERRGAWTGRTYTLVYEVSDSSGNTVEVPLHVEVPHDQRRSHRR